MPVNVPINRQKLTLVSMTSLSMTVASMKAVHTIILSLKLLGTIIDTPLLEYMSYIYYVI